MPIGSKKYAASCCNVRFTKLFFYKYSLSTHSEPVAQPGGTECPPTDIFGDAKSKGSNNKQNLNVLNLGDQAYDRGGKTTKENVIKGHLKNMYKYEMKYEYFSIQVRGINDEQEYSLSTTTPVDSTANKPIIWFYTWHQKQPFMFICHFPKVLLLSYHIFSKIQMELKINCSY